jgi:hypothetical protein
MNTRMKTEAFTHLEASDHETLADGDDHPTGWAGPGTLHLRSCKASSCLRLATCADRAEQREARIQESLARYSRSVNNHQLRTWTSLPENTQADSSRRDAGCAVAR